MTRKDEDGETVELSLDYPFWDRFFTVAPLVVVGTVEGDGYDLAPKHMAMPLGWSRYFGFVCTPRHATYGNAREDGAFTVSFPNPSQVLVSSLAATPRCGEGTPTPGLEELPVEPARVVDGVVLADAYAYLECELDRVIDGFDDASLVIGRVVAARVRREALRRSEADDQALIDRSPLLAYLDPGRYATVSESHAFPFPADFQR